MKFEIEATYSCGAGEVIREYPILNDYGFELVDEHYTFKQPIKNPDGGYLIQETLSVRKRAFINIDTFDELMKLSLDVGQALILFMPENHGNVDIPSIEIYDGYRE